MLVVERAGRTGTFLYKRAINDWLFNGTCARYCALNAQFPFIVFKGRICHIIIRTEVL